MMKEAVPAVGEIPRNSNGARAHSHRTTADHLQRQRDCGSGASEQVADDGFAPQAEAGALMEYGADLVDLYFRAASFMDYREPATAHAATCWDISWCKCVIPC